MASSTNTLQGPEPQRAADAAFAPYDFGLYALTVIGWSVSWYAIALQVGVVSNEVNLVWRFAISTVVMVAWVVLTRRSMRFGLADHLRFAGLGIFIFSSNFILFYYGALHLVSGLLSVVFSLASVINMMLAALVIGERPSRRVALGGLAGFAGIALMFLPEMQRTGFSTDTAIGLGFCLLGTLSFCTGNLISASAQRRKIPLIPMNAWGMVYGTAWSTLLAIAFGREFIIEPTLSYVGSLVFLAVVSTVLAFAAYLTLLGRIGPARAGYATVMFPVFALLVSTFLEGYQWTAWAVAGLVLVAAGNVLVIRGAARPTSRA